MANPRRDDASTHAHGRRCPASALPDKGSRIIEPRLAPDDRFTFTGRIWWNDPLGACHDACTFLALAILLVAIIGALALGRWLQRKGTDIEAHHKDASR